MMIVTSATDKRVKITITINNINAETVQTFKYQKIERSTFFTPLLERMNNKNLPLKSIDNIINHYSVDDLSVF